MTGRLLGSIVGVLVAAGSAVADRNVIGDVSLPPISDGEQIVNVVYENGQVQMWDAQSGRALIESRGKPLYENAPGQDGVRADIRFQAQPDGFDLLYTFTNVASVPQEIGRTQLAVAKLGPAFEWFDFRLHGWQEAGHLDDFTQRIRMYPDQLYSPVAVAKDDEYAMGFSVQYPLMQYQHDIAINLRQAVGRFAREDPANRGLQFEVRFSDAWTGEAARKRVDTPAVLNPGERKRYVTSFRVTKRPDEWMRTLTPYRDYFRSVYGGVHYQRDARPVQSVMVASTDMTSPSNPLGLRWPAARPDREGWGFAVSDMLGYQGWERQMMWLPSGAYRIQQDFNFPFQFTSHWLSTPELSSALSPTMGFPRFAAAGRDLGLWWGRSLQVSDRWEPSEMHNFELSNPQDRELAFRELDIAVQAGATEIGLDTFDHERTPAWDRYRWMTAMQERAPGVKFIIEPVTCDVLHSIAPTFFRTHERDPQPESDSWEDISKATNPFWLADFLLPGHETWGHMAYSRIEAYLGMEFTPERIHQDMSRMASMGYVPVFVADMNLQTPNLRAVETWLASVPVRLQIPRDQWYTPNHPGPFGEDQGGEAFAGTAPNAGPTPGGSDPQSGTASGVKTVSGGTGAGTTTSPRGVRTIRRNAGRNR